MSNWPGKYVIGLTGNIATGKSVVRKMLEHLGAYTIDADALTHRAIAKGAPGYQPVVDTFGKWVLDSIGQIDREKLGNVVFNDPDALKNLEAIVHPLVEQAVDMLAKRASQRVIVIEAIKLLESKLKDACDTVWVTDASVDLQISRLVRKRNMSKQEAETRVKAQGPQDEKVNAATVVIRNIGSYDDLWKQVSAAWKVIEPRADSVPVIVKKATKADDFSVQRGRPKDSRTIADLLGKLSNGKQKPENDDIMAAFGEKAFLLLTLDDRAIGLAAWQVENLVTRTTDLYIDPGVDFEQAAQTLLTEVEKASNDLQSEAALLFVKPALANQSVWTQLEYQKRSPKELGVQAWQDAAIESMPPDTVLLFKQLRKDRILRPI
ncbi:MAG: dephospho-CoA kinase [Anaerolineales bacterium]|nr:dephospho-CoA kinase [Anaerolineales bacterium]